MGGGVVRIHRLACAGSSRVTEEVLRVQSLLPGTAGAPKAGALAVAAAL